MKLTAAQKEDLARTFIPSFLFVLLLWAIHIFQVQTGISFNTFGIYPKTIYGLKGIFFAPLIHADFNHLINNSIPLLILTTTICHFYNSISLKLFSLLWLVTGMCVWIGGREAYHIGASGLIYGEASFLFFSGVFRKNIRLAAISLLVVFLYGGMVWGVFPIFREISWESHLFGGFTGLTFAFVFKDESPFNEMVEIEDEDEDDYYLEDDEVFTKKEL